MALVGVPVNAPVVVSKLAQDGLPVMLKLVVLVAVGVKEYEIPAVSVVAGVPEIMGWR